MTRSVLFGYLLIATCLYAAGEHGARPRALDARIPQLGVVGQPFEVVLRELVRRAEGRFVIGLEVAAKPADSKAANLSFSLEDVNVEQVLVAMCSLDPRYTYAENQPGVIEVRPVNEPPVLRELLELRIDHLDLQTKQWFSNLFIRFPEFVPDLGKYLYNKATEWARRTGKALPGSPGSILGGDVIPPEVSIHLENTTVRGVLNSLSAYTLEHSTKDRGDGIPLSAKGWRVEFVPDPQAPTGLGGYVKWSAFP
ncbi:MAG: hypothetical protein LLG20_13065 [Acidobacteriales bacterium]|nr:hypothetical protein [Terriglobales bacterium]